VGGGDAGVGRTMTRMLTHRGPDGEGVEIFRARDGTATVVLGHRRLSIIDPTARGARPMSYAAGRVSGRSVFLRHVTAGILSRLGLLLQGSSAIQYSLRPRVPENLLRCARLMGLR
jgi:hypothetical protein